jgi:hypothetical protein
LGRDRLHHRYITTFGSEQCGIARHGGMPSGKALG